MGLWTARAAAVPVLKHAMLGMIWSTPHIQGSSVTVVRASPGKQPDKGLWQCCSVAKNALEAHSSPQVYLDSDVSLVYSIKKQAAQLCTDSSHIIELANNAQSPFVPACCVQCRLIHQGEAVAIQSMTLQIDIILNFHNMIWVQSNYIC